MISEKSLIPLILIMIITFPNLFAQESIIDSVFSSWQLDGEIFFRESTQSFEILDITTYMIIGDTGMGINPDPNSRSRGYLSFQLPDIPDGYFLDSTYVRINQYNCYGNNEQGIFPIWNVAGGDTLFCVIDHIEYGYSLDSGDWTAGDYEDPQTLQTNIGIISDNNENGYRYFEVTDYVQEDYNNSRDKSQYRIRFPLETDWDYWNDKIYIHTGEGSNIYSAVCFFTYTQQNSSMNDELKIVTYSKIYPNPFSNVTSIEYQIVKSSYIKLQIFNIKGQLIETLVNDYQKQGMHSVTWNADDQNSGLYIYKLTTGTKMIKGKCVLIK